MVKWLSSLNCPLRQEHTPEPEHMPEPSHSLNSWLRVFPILTARWKHGSLKPEEYGLKLSFQ
uniref:Uncharacterized protein n=1 Tax=Picea glauca TaxID=3330 RepID=A0A101LX95_PICGL|nr:hypothetical protein ABT39_MTgene6009 [Picea glauca]QHR86840.1 hypothetical protein Q903MT_gene847 [Picea sitchensis]